MTTPYNERCGIVDKKQALEFLKTHDNYTILTHKNPDGDTLGSGFGLAMLLNSLCKSSTVICSDEIPEKYGYFAKFAPQNCDLGKKTTVIAVDVADSKLLGDLEDEYKFVRVCTPCNHGAQVIEEEE